MASRRETHQHQRFVVSVARPDGRADTSETLSWEPRGAGEALVIQLADVFAP